MDASNPVPVKLDKFIRLTLDEELSKEDTKKWYRTVETYSPSGVMSSFQMVKPSGEPDDVLLLHKKTKSGKHIYDIPLKRDLTDREAYEIVEAWGNTYPDGDFLLECSQAEIGDHREMLRDAIIVSEDSYEKLCEALAKSQHSLWINERSDKGWRYSEEYNRDQKTHPMMRPWQDLPEEYRNIDIETPNIFLEELQRFGFSVVKTEELERLVSEVYDDEYEDCGCDEI